MSGGGGVGWEETGNGGAGAVNTQDKGASDGVDCGVDVDSDDVLCVRVCDGVEGVRVVCVRTQNVRADKKREENVIKFLLYRLNCSA